MAISDIIRNALKSVNKSVDGVGVSVRFGDSDVEFDATKLSEQFQPDDWGRNFSPPNSLKIYVATKQDGKEFPVIAVGDVVSVMNGLRFIADLKLDPTASMVTLQLSPPLTEGMTITILGNTTDKKRDINNTFVGSLPAQIDADPSQFGYAVNSERWQIIAPSGQFKEHLHKIKVGSYIEEDRINFKYPKLWVAQKPSIRSGYVILTCSAKDVGGGRR